MTINYLYNLWIALKKRLLSNFYVLVYVIKSALIQNKLFKFKHLFLFVICIIVSHASFSQQCQSAASFTTAFTTPSACNTNYTKSMGAGEYAPVTLSAGVTYTFVLTTATAQGTGICINNGGNLGTSTAYTPASSTSYTVAVYRANGTWVSSSAVITYSVSPTVGGTVSGGATVCSGSNSTNLTLSGHTGTITKWQSSTVSDFSSAVTDIANTTTSLTATNLAATTYYRAVVVNGPCATVNSASATITVTSLPTTQATTFTASSITATTMSLAWTRGNGSNVLIIAKATSAPTDPASGSSYTGNANYTSGTAVGGGYAVYNGAGRAVNLTGLTAGTTYHFAAYEYNGTGCYNLTQLTGNFCTQPAKPGFITGVVSQEPAATGQTYSIVAVTGATGYTWTVPTGWSVTGGAGTNSITVTVGSNGQDGNITVTADNACGSSDAQILGVAASNPPTPADMTGTTTVEVCKTTALTVPVPTGGTESTSGNFRIHKFTADGDFIVPTGFVGDIEVLIVAGGGSGGPSIGGGGGGGGVLHIPGTAVTAGTYSQVVGAGGVASGTTVGVSGSNSTGFGATAAGGGGGGRYHITNGLDGGSSGGAGANAAGGSYNIAGNATGSSLGGLTGNIFGNTGGDLHAVRIGTPTRSAGGGGAGGPALNTDPTSMGTGHGAGGPGIGNAILGTLYYWGGGGGAGSYYNTGAGDGGLGGSGGGGETNAGPAGVAGASGLNAGSAGSIGGNVNGGAAGANTGSGGGGGTWSTGLGGNGGSGIVVVSYPVMTGGSWTSSNTAIATVDASGVVTGVLSGTVTITYTVTKGSTTSSTNTVVTVTEPTQATTFTYTSITSTTMTLGWTRGTGTGGVLIIARAGSAPTDPTSGSNYTGNAAYASGTAVGGGFAVYKGTGTSVALTNLAVGTTYYFAAYEFNTGDCYNLTELTGSSCPIPGQPSLMNSD